MRYRGGSNRRVRLWGRALFLGPALQKARRHSLGRDLAGAYPQTKQATPFILPFGQSLYFLVGIHVRKRQARLRVLVPRNAVCDDTMGSMPGLYK